MNASVWKTCHLLTAVSLLSGSLAAAKMTAREIYEKYASGVVLVVASHKDSSSASAGSGTIVSPDGQIVTNAHVIYDVEGKKPFDVVNVFLKPDRVTGDMNRDLTRFFPADVVAYDVALDLALLKMKKPPSGLTVITLGNPDDLIPGDEVITIGHPEQGGLWTITKGIIGAEFQDFKGVAGKHVFQVDASVNRGNSGGLLADWRGYQVGVNTAIARQGAGGVAVTGVNFSIKSSVVKDWIAKHDLRLAFGTDSLNPQGAPVAVADASPPPTAPPAAPPVAPTAVPPNDGKTFRDPASKGSIKVEEPDREAIAMREQPKATDVRRPVEPPPAASPPAASPPKAPPPEANPRRTPNKVEAYSIPPRPYTFNKLFTAVDKVRERSRAAFDDLDREIERRKR